MRVLIISNDSLFLLSQKKKKNSLSLQLKKKFTIKKKIENKCMVLYLLE